MSGKVATVRRKVEQFEVVATEGPPGWRLQSLGRGSVGPVDEFLLRLAAGGASPTPVRSYAYDLLRWWRWLTASPIGWDVATRTDVRDLVLWMQSQGPPAAGWRPRRSTIAWPCCRRSTTNMSAPEPLIGRRCRRSVTVDTAARWNRVASVAVLRFASGLRQQSYAG